ncbi:MAG TPA: glycosyltransferase [Aeromicrobium sp.]|nr:glycosyltransferase [Aeromicrobium sp.]
MSYINSHKDFIVLSTRSNNRVSVVMCTYNGARFVEEQLRSISLQLSHGDELVIADDGSTDETLDIVDRILRASLPIDFDVSILPGSTKSRGISANFWRGVQAANNSVVILSDQDDSWLANRVERVRQEFGKHMGLKAFACDARLIDKYGANLGHTQFDSVGVGAGEIQVLNGQAGFEYLARGNVLPGMTGAFDTNFLREIGPAPGSWPHDYWWFLHAAMFDGLEVTNETLVNYRQHDSNTIGAPPTRLAALAIRFWKTPSNAAVLHENFQQLWEACQSTELNESARRNLGFLREKKAFERWRGQLRPHMVSRLIPVLKRIAFGDYRRFSRRGGLRGIHDIVRNPQDQRATKHFSAFETRPAVEPDLSPRKD